MRARNLYDLAKEISHKHGYDWTDPRTGRTHPAPKKPKAKKKNG